MVLKLWARKASCCCVFAVAMLVSAQTMLRINRIQIAERTRDDHTFWRTRRPPPAGVIGCSCGVLVVDCARIRAPNTPWRHSSVQILLWRAVWATCEHTDADACADARTAHSNGVCARRCTPSPLDAAAGLIQSTARAAGSGAETQGAYRTQHVRAVCSCRKDRGGESRHQS